MPKMCQILHDTLPRMMKIWADEAIPGYFVKSGYKSGLFCIIYERMIFQKGVPLEKMRPRYKKFFKKCEIGWIQNPSVLHYI